MNWVLNIEARKYVSILTEDEVKPGFCVDDISKIAEKGDYGGWGTAVFGKVYRTIFQRERVDDLSSKQGSISTLKLFKNILKYIFTNIYICYKIKTL